MATFNKPIATNQGIALLKAQVAGSDSITFTKTVFSADDYSQSADSDIANLTAIQSMDLTVPAQTFQDVNGNTKVRAIGYNNSVNQAFYIKTYALYAKNKAGNEILFAVASSQTADFVPAFNNAQLTQISYTFTFAIDQTSNITLSDQHEITVTQADIASINNAVNSNASSLSSSMSSVSNSLSSSISNNSSAITALSNASITYQGKISSFNQGNKQGLYKYFDGTTSSTLTVIQYNDVLIQTRIDTWDANGATFADDDYAPKMRLSADGGNTWSAWSELATQYDVQSINNTATSLANSLATQTSNMSNSISSNSANIASNASAISSNATSTSSAISSVSSSNNAVSSSIASTVSVNQSNIANNSSAINSLVSSASSAIGSNATNISTNSSAISSMQSALAQNANNLSSFIKSAVTTQYLANGTDFNTVTQSGMYSIQNGYQSYPNAYYPGTEGMLIVFNDGASEVVQQVITLDGTGGVRINYRIQSVGGVWCRWIAQATSDDINNNALIYRGNLPSTHMANITQTGIYNLNGIQTDDGPYPIQWGQLVVLNSGGVINQEVHDSSGTLFTRSINSWGIVGWNTNKH